MLTPLPVSLSVWLAQPSAEAIARAEASSPGDLLTRSGKAAMVCVVRGDGRLDACRIDDAKSDPGFAAPILALADQYLLDITHPPADSRVEVAVAFPKLVDGPLKPTAAPAPADFVARLPPGLHGRARMNCLVTVRGDTTDCLVEDGAAHDRRLVTAALVLASNFHFEPPTLRGQPSGAATLITFITKSPFLAPSGAHVASGLVPAFIDPTIAVGSPLDNKIWVRCSVKTDGMLVDCKVVSGSTTTSDAAAVALWLAPQFRFREATSRRPFAEGKSTTPLGVAASNASTSAGDLDTGNFRLLPWATWDAAPTWQEVAAVFPSRALAARVFGRAVLGCDITADGALRRCSSITEAPKGADFGPAAMRLAPKFHAVFHNVSGSSQAKVAIPIDFSERSLKPGTERDVRQPEWRRTIDGGELGAAFPAPRSRRASSAEWRQRGAVSASKGFWRRAASRSRSRRVWASARPH